MNIGEMNAELTTPNYRRRVDASKYLKEKWGLRYAPPTLAKLASIGGGPSFVHAGRFPLYPESELDEWARSRISPLKRSTSDTGVEGHDAVPTARRTVTVPAVPPDGD